MAKKQTTIVDIADICGVSVKTVSRVINKDKKVAPATREKVIKALRENDYHSNVFARGLKGEKSGIIVIFVDRHNGDYFTIWHGEILRYLFQYIRAAGMKVIVSPSNSMEAVTDDTDGFSILASGMADGAILLENVHKDSRIKYFRDHNVPFVLFGEPDVDDIYSVSLDNYQVGYEGGRYLIEKGYHDILFFVGEKKFVANQHRIQGFEDAVKESGIKYKVYTEIDSIDKAYLQTQKVISNNCQADALFVSGDERVMGVYKALREAGKSIPNDIAVMGVDNIMYGKYYFPTLTTIDQNFEEMAKKIVEKLEQQLSGNEEADSARKTRINPKVIERDST